MGDAYARHDTADAKQNTKQDYPDHQVDFEEAPLRPQHVLIVRPVNSVATVLSQDVESVVPSAHRASVRESVDGEHDELGQLHHPHKDVKQNH